MNKETSCRTHAPRDVVANVDIDPSLQTHVHKAQRLDIELAAARRRSIDTLLGTTLGGSGKPKVWPEERRPTAAAGAGPTREGDCLEEMGTLCPKLVEARAAKALSERQLIELAHRHANMLQLLVARIARQRSLQGNPAVQNELDGLLASVHALAQLNRCLLPPRELIHVDLATLFVDIAAAIEGVTELRCDVRAEAMAVPGQVAILLAAAVNELAWNAYKHAYGGRAAGNLIRIVCRCDGQSRLRISVADCGRGLPDGFDPNMSDGLGLMVVCAIAQQFGGELLAESDGGACFTLLLPIPAFDGDSR